MSSVLVIGYGNTLRGDDAIGWLAAEALLERKIPDVTVVKCQQLGPELTDALAASDHAVFVDAAAVGPPGSIRCAEVTPFVSDEGFTHAFNPSMLLQLTKALHGRAPRAIEVTLGGESFELSEELSPAVRAALPRLIELVSGQVKELRSA